jgi:5'-3' exonuclease
MILIDYSQTAISNLMQEVGHRTDIDINVPLLRHMIINSIRGYKQKFGEKFGTPVITCDNMRYWRKEYFPYYKAGRKKARDESGLDWKAIFEALNQIKSEIDQYLPYKVLDVDGAEADDVIATLCEWSQTNYMDSGTLFDEPKPVLIVSGDHDFIQLQKYSNIHQYSPIQKKFIKPDVSPEKYIFEHIMRGDKGDGIPNVLSDDDSIVNNVRQKPILSKKIDVWFKEPSEMPQDETFKRNYERNKNLISLDKIPEDIKTRIINSFVDSPDKDRTKLFDFFVKNRMKNMLELIEEF